MRVIMTTLFIFGLAFCFSSCHKYLEEKPFQNLYVPSTLEDLQALLDNNDFMNRQFGSSLNDVVGDDYFIRTEDWQAALSTHQDNYLWKSSAQELENWQYLYEGPVYYSNLVLDNLERIKEERDGAKFKQIYGAALFYRAMAFYTLSQLYCKPYSIANIGDPGIVLRLTSAVETKSVRSTIGDTYEKIVNDLEEAIRVLPEQVTSTMRPSKSAAFALLSRIYLNMSLYSKCEAYADSALTRNRSLIDFNTLIPSTAPRLPTFDNNKEIIFFAMPRVSQLLLFTICKIDSNLYSSYQIDDLRKKVFFQENVGANAGSYRFKGSYYTYSQGFLVFSGLTTGELFLNKAECLARRGEVNDAMKYINDLRRARISQETYVDISFDNQNDALVDILSERRRELVFRGLRWSDIRRLNSIGSSITPKRIIDGKEYTLPPNDLRYVLLIPNEEVSRSGIEQNKR